MDGRKIDFEALCKNGRKFYYYPKASSDSQTLELGTVYAKMAAKHYIRLHSKSRTQRYIWYIKHWLWMLFISWRSNTPKAHLFVGPIVNRKKRKLVMKAHKDNMDLYK